MNFTLIIIAIIVVAILIVLAGIWLNKKGITKDDNDNYIPDVLEDKAKDIKKKAKDIGNIVKNKK
jgi:FtsZ-interacting cell division protein ZipA|tara:strand:+ start:954 stop:1148 length:195 start_codon:yes stop_codon:yes gene_type:complete